MLVILSNNNIYVLYCKDLQCCVLNMFVAYAILRQGLEYYIAKKLIRISNVVPCTHLSIYLKNLRICKL